MSYESIILIIAGLFTALFAGLLFSFSVAVVPGLRAAPAKDHISVMQTINKKIENPIFFLSFGLPIVLLPLSAYIFRKEDVFVLLVIASVLQIAGGVGVTAAGNIPLNNELAQVNVEQISDKEAEVIRTDFQKPYSKWMNYHLIRTLASIGATSLVLIALYQLSSNS